MEHDLGKVEVAGATPVRGLYSKMIINIKVRPSKRETKIISKDGDNYIIDLKARPEKGKANLELIKFLRRHFGKDVEIISGYNNRKKIVKIN